MTGKFVLSTVLFAAIFCRFCNGLSDEDLSVASSNMADYNPSFSGENPTDFIEVDVDEMLNTCLPYLPETLKNQKILTKYEDLKWPKSAFQYRDPITDNYFSPTLSFSYGVKLCQFGEACNATENMYASDELSWRTQFVGRRSQDVGWILSTWEMRDFNLSQLIGSGSDANSEETEEAEAEVEQIHDKYATPDSPRYYVKALGLMYRVPKDDGSFEPFFDICQLGCRQSSDNTPGTTCDMRFNLRYVPGQGNITLGRTFFSSMVEWSGNLTLLDKNIGKKGSFSILAGSNNERLDYIFTKDKEVETACPTAPANRKSNSFHNYFGWKYPKDISKNNGVLLDMDPNPTAVSNQNGQPEYVTEMGSDVLNMNLLCAESTVAEETKTGSSFFFRSGQAFLPRGNLLKGCFSPNFWLYPQSFPQIVLQNSAPLSENSTNTGRVAFTLDTNIPERGYKLHYVSLEGKYDQESGTVCGVACMRQDSSSQYVGPADFSNSSDSTQEAFMGTQGSVVEGGAGETVEESPDCLVKVTVLVPRYYPWPLIYFRPPLRMKLESMRSPQDPKYFKTISFHQDSFRTEEEASAIYERSEAKLVGGVLIGSLMLSCVASQIRHLRKHEEEVTNISLLSPLSFSLGLILSVISCILDDSFRGLAGYFWGRFTNYSLATPPTVQALLASVSLLSLYLSYSIVTLRYKKGYSWTGSAKWGRGEREGEGERATELSLLQEEGEVSSVFGSRKVGSGTSNVDRFLYWGPSRSHILCLPFYIVALLVSLGTLLQWYPLDFLNMLEKRNSRYPYPAYSVDDVSSAQKRLAAMITDGPAHNISSSPSLAVPLYQTGVVLGMFGSLLQDMFLIPQIFLSSSMSKVTTPLSRFFVYGISTARIGAHLLEPFSLQMATVGVLLSAVFYYLLNDYVLMKARRKV